MTGIKKHILSTVLCGIFLFGFVMAFSIFVAPAYAGSGHDNIKNKGEKTVVIETGKDRVIANALAIMAMREADNDPRRLKNKKVYGLRKIYENRDVAIYRAHDKDGKNYTITKRKSRLFRR